MIQRAGLLLAVCLLVGCATYRGVPLNRIPEQVSVGDDVRLTTRDGEELEFEVSAVGESELSGGGETRAFRDLALVERRKHPRITAEVVLGWVIVPLAAVGLIALTL